MIKFIKYCFYQMMLIMVMFDIVLYALMLFFLKISYYNIWVYVGISIILTLVAVIFSYIRNNDYFEQLYIKVYMEYKIRDDYKNYIKIRDIILNYSFNSELVNVKQNISVLQAAIERDKAYNIFYSALVTVCGVSLKTLWGENEMINMNIMPMFLLIFLVYLQVGRRTPKNSFIKKVVESIYIE